MGQKVKGNRELREDKDQQVFRKRIVHTYCVVLVIMIGMVLTNVFVNTNGKVDVGLEEFASITDALKWEDGKPLKAEEIDTYKLQNNEQVTVVYQLPNVLKKDETIVFRSKNTYVEVFLNQEKRYETEYRHAAFYNHSPGTRWNFVSIPKEKAGGKVEFKVKLAYDDGRSKVDRFYFGDRAAIVIHLIATKGVGIIFCLILFVMGLVYMCANAVLNRGRTEKDLSLYYLSVFAIISSIWALLETNVLQLFVNNLPLIQLMDNMLLILGTIPLFLYMEHTYRIFRFRVMRWFCVINMLYMSISTLSQMFGWYDYHQMLNAMMTNYGIVIITLMGCLMRQAFENRKSKKKDSKYWDYLMQQCGMFTLWGAITIDFLRYFRFDVMDRAKYTRAGLVIFIIFFGTGSIFRLSALVKQGRESELISKLAYYDGLTEVGNRTAYMENMERLEHKVDGGSCCIVMFDINNLKELNDSLGHQYGDRLIKEAAEIIKRSFGVVGEVYRIGGDEFTALIVNRNPIKSYRQALKAFNDCIEMANTDRGWDLPISIAHGIGYCETLTKENLRVSEQEADANMYKNKAEMKKLAAEAVFE